MFDSTDYDKLRQIMEESSEKKELLSKLLASQQMTISTISHEIRNPLTLVYSTLQLIESQHPEVLTYKYWSDLRGDIEYMKFLLEDLSSYNNGNRLHMEEINMDTFLKTICVSFAASIVDTEIAFTSKVGPELPAISGDSLKLKEVLLNLLTNARDAVLFSMDHPDFHPEIRLRAYISDEQLIIDIVDNGCGIEPEELTHIFEPFVTHKASGTGLGLAIASRIAASHGGSLHASSIPGVTTFTLSLPIKQN